MRHLGDLLRRFIVTVLVLALVSSISGCGGGDPVPIDPEALGYTSAALNASLAFPGAEKDKTIHAAVSDAEIIGVKTGKEETVLVDLFTLKDPSEETGQKVVDALADLLVGKQGTKEIAGTEVTTVDTKIADQARRYLIFYDESSGTVVAATSADPDAAEAFATAVLED